MNRWVLNKDLVLEDILLTQGDIDAQTRDLMAALVDKHIQFHGHDVGRSLAAVSPVPADIRDEITNIGDADLGASLRLIATQGFVETGAERSEALVPSGASPGTRYEVLRPHAEGGLGCVLIARDRELNREVALKEIRARYANDPNSRARFLIEAEITGRLEHPGIVPVYGLGTYQDGRPFYAMRFIEGDNLHEAVARFHETAHDSALQRAMQLRQLLGRFVDICHAVAYAHSRGVLHRDLKPGNILLGRFGETLVVDWGLAKVVGRVQGDESASGAALEPASASGQSTQAGSALGTPAYMSPEQAAGRLHELGPGSDVYSLGATLYFVLTGRAPFQGKDIPKIIEAVQRADFPAPRKVRPGVATGLSAICLKAMSLSPAHRYASAESLASDVEQWLADEPVSAYREPWNMRVARLIRRHPMLMTATAAGLVGVFVGLSIFGFVSTRNARPVLDKSIEYDLQAYEEAQSAIEDDISPEVVEFSHLVFLAGSATENQGLGEKARAYRQALAIQEQLVQRRPSIMRLQTDLADDYREAARFFGRQGLLRDATDVHDKCLTLLNRLTAEWPKVPTLTDSLAAEQADFAWLLATCADPEFRSRNRSLELAQSANELTGFRNHPIYLDTLAAALARAGDFEGAVSKAQDAVAQAPEQLRPAFEARRELYRKNIAYEEPVSIFPSKVHP